MHSKRQFDHITLCSPSGALLDESRLDQAITQLQKYHLPIIEQTNVRARHQRFAGTDEQRIEAIEMACCLPQGSLIMATRGGYGLSRILPMLNFEKMAQSLNRYQHVLCGHSDITVLQLALLAAGALPETLLHGPMACYDFGEEQGVHPETKHPFDQAIFDGNIHLHWKTGLGAVNLPGSITGPAWGGNLTMLTSLLGTPWQPKIQEGLLILEDVNESAYKLERKLLQLLQAGILGSQRVVIMGDFSGPEPCQHDNGFSVKEVFNYFREKYGLFIVENFPFGHVQPKACWFQGGQAKLSFFKESDQTFQFTFEQTVYV